MTTWPEGGREPMDEIVWTRCYSAQLARRRARKMSEQGLGFPSVVARQGPRPNRDTIAKARAKVLAKRPEMWANYVVLSETSPLAWKTLPSARGGLVESGSSVGGLVLRAWEVAISPLLCWSLDVAAGKRKEPKKPGPDPTKNYYRDSAIALTVGGDRQCRWHQSAGSLRSRGGALEGGRLQEA